MKRLTGSHTPTAPIARGGTIYRDCPAWVSAAVERCVSSGLVPRPAEVIWHARQTTSRWGTCWPAERRIHLYPWAGHREEVDDEIDIDVSGEVRRSNLGSRVVPGAQLSDDLEDTLAHELAHLVHARHDAEHRSLTQRLLQLIRP